MFKLFKRARRKSARAGRSLLVFEHTGEVLRAEKALKSQGLEVRVMGPPPEVRTGCDMVVEFPMVEELLVRQILDKAGVQPLKVLPVNGPLLEPVSLFHVTDYGDYLMVRAANMKLAVRKKDRVIVNVSGGGCPDVPYIAARIVGQSLDDATPPREMGSTLCGFALHLAYEEAVRLCSA